MNSTADRVFTRKADQQVVELSKSISECPTDQQKRLHNDHQIGVAGEFSHSPLKVTRGDLAEIVTKISEESSNFVFHVEEFCPQQLTRSESGPDALTGWCLDVNDLVESDAHHLRDPSSVVAIGLVKLSGKRSLHVSRLHADNRKHGRGEPGIEILRKHPCFEADALDVEGQAKNVRGDSLRIDAHLWLMHDLTSGIDDTDIDRTCGRIETDEVLSHGDRTPCVRFSGSPP